MQSVLRAHSARYRRWSAADLAVRIGVGLPVIAGLIVVAVSWPALVAVYGAAGFAGFLALDTLVSRCARREAKACLALNGCPWCAGPAPGAADGSHRCTHCARRFTSRGTRARERSRKSP